jgi:hypothetical protein
MYIYLRYLNCSYTDVPRCVSILWGIQYRSAPLGKTDVFAGLKGVKLRIYITQYYLYKFQRSKD